MRHIFTLLFAVLAFTACTQNDVEELSANRADVPEILTIGFEGDDTRIQLEASKTVWTSGDLVSVFYKSDANQQWEYRGETGARVADLYCVDKGVESSRMNYVVVAYPYNPDYIISTASGNIETTLPAVQHYAEESYGVGENLMVSQSEFTQFSLKSVCGWLKIQLTGNGEKVTRLTLRGNNEEQVAGLIYVDTATAESTLASEMGSADDNNAGGNLVFDDAIVTELTLDCGEGVVLGAEATSFYFAIPPQTFEGGFTVDVECEDSEPMTISTENRITIQRNTIQPMATMAFEGEEVIPYNEIRYTATAKVEAHSYYPWTLDTFGANVVSNEWNSETGKGIITFDADVTTIGGRAFEDCDSLTSITIPDSVTTIEYVAFAYCTNLVEFNGKFASEDGRCLIVDGTLNSFAPAGLTSYTIPDSVTTIGDYAFADCNSLISITIPDSVTTIGEGAFNTCDSLTSVTIGNSVTTIGYSAFAFCYSLTNITIPDSVTTIEYVAFAYCTNLVEFNGKFASEDGRCLIVDGTLNSFAPAGLTSYTIPDSVTTIGNFAFYSCDILTSITIPNSVTTIGYDAFYSCDSLTSISIPDSVTTIGDDAFSVCYSLTSVTIPDSVTTIGGGAFQYCYSLTSITIPDSVTTIGDYAFYNCDNLTSVYCEATTPPSLGGGYVFDYNASGRLIYVPTESVEAYKTAEYWSEYADAIVAYDFENGVVVEPEVSINNVIHYTATAKVEMDWTFDTFGANIDYNEWDSESGEGVITFDTDVTTIGKYAFEDCLSLTGITIPDSVTTIGEGAFYLCRYLTGITIPNSVTTIGEMAFTSCSSLTNITIPDSVTTIENKTFYDCESLINITIPDSVTSIGVQTFCGCSDLTSISIPDSVTTIGNEAFACCQSLTEFNGELASEDGRCLIIDGTLSAFAPTGLTSYTIPDSVTTIGDSAFRECVSLTSVTIPDSVTTIGDGAFYYCPNLTSITIPNSVTTIGDGAFYYCSNLTSITIPNSVTTIRDNAFRNCDSLTSVTIPDSVTTIGEGAFYDCDSLTSITIPNSVTTIGDCAFYYCSNLTSITIPNSVTTIGAGAFYYCSKLASITIPNSVTTIGNEAFDLCRSLANVYCEATTPPSLGSYAFSRNASGRTIYVPAVSVEAYKTADYWSEYADAIVAYDFEKGEVVEPETPTSTKPSNDEIWYTTSYNTNPYNSYREPFDVEIISNTYDSENERWVIKLAGEVTKINDSAFEGQGQFMTSITIPESVTEIGNFAFNNCFELKAIDIPKNVTSIGNWAFHYCTSFTSVTIPNSVETIGDYAFAYCEKLAEFKGKFAADNGRCLIVNGDLNAYAIGCNTTQYTIPDGVVSLGERSFAGAVKLTEVVIPSSVNEVCSQAFQDCSSLASLYCESQLPPTFGSGALHGVASNLRIYVPAESVEAYKTAAGWSTYANAIVGYDFENGVVVE